MKALFFAGLFYVLVMTVLILLAIFVSKWFIGCVGLWGLPPLIALYWYRDGNYETKTG